MDGTNPEYMVVGFDISGVEYSGFATTLLGELCSTPFKPSLELSRGCSVTVWQQFSWEVVLFMCSQCALC